MWVLFCYSMLSISLFIVRCNFRWQGQENRRRFHRKINELHVAVQEALKGPSMQGIVIV